MEPKPTYPNKILSILTPAQLDELVDSILAVQGCKYGSVRIIILDGEVCFIEMNQRKKFGKPAKQVLTEY